MIGDIKAKVSNVVSVVHEGNQTFVFTEVCFDNEDFDDLVDFMAGLGYEYKDSRSGTHTFETTYTGENYG